ncbi:MAG: hypothetical protein EBV28_08170 [Betaproteobacteria bacterium]|nr:hypothetical protein [Betaproteobacteria bacterium]
MAEVQAQGPRLLARLLRHLRPQGPHRHGHTPVGSHLGAQPQGAQPAVSRVHIHHEGRRRFVALGPLTVQPQGHRTRIAEGDHHRQQNLPLHLGSERVDLRALQRVHGPAQTALCRGAAHRQAALVAAQGDLQVLVQASTAGQQGRLGAQPTAGHGLLKRSRGELAHARQCPAQQIGQTCQWQRHRCLMTLGLGFSKIIAHEVFEDLHQGRPCGSLLQKPGQLRRSPGWRARWRWGLPRSSLGSPGKEALRQSESLPQGVRRCTKAGRLPWPLSGQPCGSESGTGC